MIVIPVAYLSVSGVSNFSQSALTYNDKLPRAEILAFIRSDIKVIYAVYIFNLLFLLILMSFVFVGFLSKGIAVFTPG